MNFCVHCGAQLASGAKFCSGCGNQISAAPATGTAASPVAASAPAPASTPPTAPPTASAAVPPTAPPTASAAVPPAVPHTQAGPVRRGGKGRWLAVGGAALAVATVAGGGAFLLLGGDEATTISSTGIERTLPEAITSDPEEAWSMPFGGEELTGFVPTKHGTLVAGYFDDNVEVVSLDDEGEEQWRTDLQYGYYLLDTAWDSEVVLAVSEDGPMEAIATDDGEALWHTDNDAATWFHSTTDDGLLFTSENRVELLDPATGDPVWSASMSGGGSIAVAGDRLYIAAQDELRAIDIGSGEETWTSSHGLVDSEETWISLAATKDVVVATDTEYEVAAFSTEDGAELWREVAGSHGSSVGRASQDLLFVEEDGDYSYEEDGTVRFFDKDGEIGTVEIAYDDYFSPVSFTLDGTDYFHAAGLLYDEELTVHGRYPGDVIPVDGGFYVVDEAEIGYHTPEQAGALWTRSFGGDDEYVYAKPTDDGRLIVQAARELICLQ